MFTCSGEHTGKLSDTQGFLSTSGWDLDQGHKEALSAGTRDVLTEHSLAPTRMHTQNLAER
jgi:hypothetical protein